jgi:hypothetical protein
VHADIGGGYLENEARLSDIAMRWMAAASTTIPDGLKHDGSVLKLWPDPGGKQHDEQARGWLKKGLRPCPKTSRHMSRRRRCTNPSTAALKGESVLLFDRIAQYRPANLDQHIDSTFCRPPGAPGPSH